jgi:hypothetical protein
MNTNIKGLSSLVDNLNTKIDHVSESLDNVSVTGGDGIRVSRVSSGSFVVNVDANAIAQLDPRPFDIVIDQPNPSSSQYELRTRGGQINGYLPNNWRSIGVINRAETPSEARLRYVLLYVELTPMGVANAYLTIEDESSISYESLNRVYTQEVPPSNLVFPIALLSDVTIVEQLYRGHLDIFPTFVYSVSDPANASKKLDYYSWEVSEDR